MAYAQTAGVPPQNAFYAAPVALLAYALRLPQPGRPGRDLA
ncbi:hypothetical protein [Yinghuangia sp. ASG 101]|nr:hypothetical protein [Yinghuangia sp. ASG 101]